MSEISNIEKRRPNWRKREWIDFSESQSKHMRVQTDRIEALEAALQKIVDNTPENKHQSWPHHHFYLFTANQALTPSEDN